MVREALAREADASWAKERAAAEAARQDWQLREGEWEARVAKTHDEMATIRDEAGKREKEVAAFRAERQAMAMVRRTN